MLKKSQNFRQQFECTIQQINNEDKYHVQQQQNQDPPANYSFKHKEQFMQAYNKAIKMDNVSEYTNQSRKQQTTHQSSGVDLHKPNSEMGTHLVVDQNYSVPKVNPSRIKVINLPELQQKSERTQNHSDNNEFKSKLESYK